MPPTFQVTLSSKAGKKRPGGGLLGNAMAGALGIKMGRSAGGKARKGLVAGDLRLRLGGSASSAASSGDLRDTMGKKKGVVASRVPAQSSRLADRLGGQPKKTKAGQWGHDMYFTSGQAQGIPPVEDASMYPAGDDEDDYMTNSGVTGGRKKGPGVFGGMAGGGMIKSKVGGANMKKKGRGTFTF